MPNGKSRLGFFTSSAAVETASKPIKAKNIMAALILLPILLLAK